MTKRTRILLLVVGTAGSVVAFAGIRYVHSIRISLPHIWYSNIIVTLAIPSVFCLLQGVIPLLPSSVRFTPSRLIRVGIVTSILTALTVLAATLDHDQGAMVSDYSHCLSNGCFIRSAKDQWAMAHHATNGTVVTLDDLRAYWGVDHNICYDGGTITFGRIGEPAHCTFHGDLKPVGNLEFRRVVAEKAILFK